MRAGRSTTTTHSVGSETEMEAKSVIEVTHQRGRKLAHSFANPLHGYGTHLLGLRFGIARQSAVRTGKHHLEGVDASHVRGHRHDGDDAPVESCCCGIGAIVAHDHSGAQLVRFGTAHGFEVHQTDLTAKH